MIDAHKHCRKCLKLMDLMAALLNPACTWHPIVRKAYVVLWPIAMFLRVVLFCILSIVILFATWGCAAWVHLIGVWKGEEVRW